MTAVTNGNERRPAQMVSDGGMPASRPQPSIMILLSSDSSSRVYSAWPLLCVCGPSGLAASRRREAQGPSLRLVPATLKKLDRGRSYAGFVGSCCRPSTLRAVRSAAAHAGMPSCAGSAAPSAYVSDVVRSAAAHAGMPSCAGTAAPSACVSDVRAVCHEPRNGLPIPLLADTSAYDDSASSPTFPSRKSVSYPPTRSKPRVLAIATGPSRLIVGFRRHSTLSILRNQPLETQHWNLAQFLSSY